MFLANSISITRVVLRKIPMTSRLERYELTRTGMEIPPKTIRAPEHIQLSTPSCSRKTRKTQGIFFVAPNIFV